MLKILFLLFSFIFLWNCASTPKESLYEILEKEQCPQSSFRGWGIANEEMAAIDLARVRIASEMQDTISVISKYKNVVKDEKDRTYFMNQINRSYSINNASDAKIKFKKQQGKETGVVACMAKADAAKDFLESQRLVADSLELVSNISINTEHPRHKNEAWQRTQTYYNRIVAIQNLLNGWGVAKADYFDKASEIYSKTREDYKNYCQSMKVSWQDSGNECSETVFAMLSKKIKMEKSGCSGGLNLSFNCPEKCVGSSLGIECSFNPSLAIESCGGEKYSMLKAKEPVTGSDMNNKNMAKENLIENLPKAAFFKEWEREIKEWIPLCVE